MDFSRFSFSGGRPSPFKQLTSCLSTLPWAWFLMMGLFLDLLARLTFHPDLLLHNSDGASFLILAKSLATGHGYLLASLPDPEPLFSFSPFFPVVLAVLMRLTGIMDPLAFVPIAKGFLVWVYWLSLMLTFFVFRRFEGQLGGRWVVLSSMLLLMIAATPHRYLQDVLSDIPFLCLSLAGSLCFFRASSVENPGLFQKSFLGGLGLLALLILTRPMGLALGLAQAGVCLFQKQWQRAVMVLLVCGVTFGSWAMVEHTYRATHVAQDTAVNDFLQHSPVKLSFVKYFAVQQPGDDAQVHQAQGGSYWLKKTLNRTEQYVKMVTQTFFPDKGLFKLFRLPFVVLTIMFIVFGGWRLGKLSPSGMLMGLYTLCYLGVLVLYPYVSGRYLLPLLPSLMLLFWVGFRQLYQQMAEWLTRSYKLDCPTWLLPVLLGLLLVSMMGVQLSGASHYWQAHARLKQAANGPRTSTAYGGFYDALLWLKTNVQPLQPQSVILIRKPELLYVYTRLKAKRFAFYPDPDQLFHWIQEEAARDPQGTYLLADVAFKESKQFLPPLLKKYGPAFQPVYTDPKTGTRVWRVIRRPE